eukprot:GHVS01022242.1.p2 GENE.GHVS01022242.1~~GHVS01022242.1.p2  ORF type:complete len:122 (+),score=8.25 GHVS01022242.1:593-958(+)
MKTCSRHRLLLHFRSTIGSIVFCVFNCCVVVVCKHKKLLDGDKLIVRGNGGVVAGSVVDRYTLVVLARPLWLVVQHKSARRAQLGCAAQVGQTCNWLIVSSVTCFSLFFRLRFFIVMFCTS